jgi:hypothetical protein
VLIAFIVAALPFYAKAFIGGRTGYLWGPILALAVLFMATSDKQMAKGLPAT